jgi:hypothetical protein
LQGKGELTVPEYGDTEPDPDLVKAELREAPAYPSATER